MQPGRSSAPVESDLQIHTNPGRLAVIVSLAGTVVLQQKGRSTLKIAQCLVASFFDPELDDGG